MINSEILNLESSQVFDLEVDVDNLRFAVEWNAKIFGIICDLDLILYCYDERVQIIIRDNSLLNNI